MEKNCAVATFIRNRIQVLGKRQSDIAAECGFESANVITMIKQGKTKLPIGKVGPMAKALEADPVQLLKLCMSEYQPQTWAAIEPFLDHAFTKDERALIYHFRAFAGGPYLAALTPESEKLLNQFLLSLKTSTLRH